VQAVAYGTDCRALLHALTLDPARLRGVVLITPDVTDEQLWQMHQCGVRGARFSHPPPGMTQGSIGFDVLEALAPRLRGLGWHAQIWAPCDQLATIVPRLEPLGLPLVVDHLGYFKVERGLADLHFQMLLRLLNKGRIWLKMTAYRLSKRYPNYEDLRPFHQALLAANADRLLWGSDWPHVHMTADMPEVGHLVDLFTDWTKDEGLRQKILVENPQRLYGF
jgi:2-pyrone-4,6-dicarboxylate lactonase